jgi:hypothetical protein
MPPRAAWWQKVIGLRTAMDSIPIVLKRERRRRLLRLAAGFVALALLLVGIRMGQAR